MEVERRWFVIRQLCLLIFRYCDPHVSGVAMVLSSSCYCVSINEAVDRC